MCGLIVAVMVVIGGFMIHPGLGIILLGLVLYDIFGRD